MSEPERYEARQTPDMTRWGIWDTVRGEWVWNENNKSLPLAIERARALNYAYRQALR